MRISDWSSDVCSSDLLDRHPGAREVAQLAAVGGREFTFKMLAAISELPEDELHAALKRLVEAELLYQAGLPPKATYRFKHALVQEMAYNSLLKKRRRRLHAAIAAYLKDRNPHLRSEEHRSDLQTLMRISYAGVC